MSFCLFLESDDGTVSELDVTPCPKQPCHLKRGTEVTLEVHFTPSKCTVLLNQGWKLEPAWLPNFILPVDFTKHWAIWPTHFAEKKKVGGAFIWVRIWSKMCLEGHLFECDSDQTTCRRGVYLSVNMLKNVLEGHLIEWKYSQKTCWRGIHLSVTVIKQLAGGAFIWVNMLKNVLEGRIEWEYS